VGRITQVQVYMLFAQFLYSTTIGFFISPLVKQAHFMVWVSVILGGAIALLFAYMAYRLCMTRPDHFWAQYGSEIIGKWLHYPIIALVIFVNLFGSAYILRQLTDFIVMNFLQGTPSWAVALLFGFCIARGVRSGPVTMFRSAQGLFLLSVIAVMIFPLFIVNEVDRQMLVAFHTNLDISGIWNGTVIATGLFAEMTFIVYFFPYFANREKTMLSLSGAILTAVVVTLMNLIPTIMLFGPELTANLTSPTLEIIRYIRTGTFLENLDPLLIVFWIYSMFLKIGIFLLVSIFGLTHSIGLKNHKPFSYMMSAAMIVLSICIFPSGAHLEAVTNHSETAFLLFTAMVPLLYFAVDGIRSLAKRRASEAQ
jgi:spore germination protein KB